MSGAGPADDCRFIHDNNAHHLHALAFLNAKSEILRGKRGTVVLYGFYRLWKTTIGSLVLWRQTTSCTTHQAILICLILKTVSSFLFDLTNL